MVVDETGGSHGLREESIVSSVVESPRQKVFGKELHNSVFNKAAVYARDIIMNHPFVDGNKRTGIICAGVFLENNGHKIIGTNKELEKLVLRIIKEKLDIDNIANWLEENSTPIKAS